MFVSLIAIISLVQFARANEFPNGTDTKINYFSCSPANIITVSFIELFDRNNMSMYPIKLEKLAAVKLKAYNNGNVIVKDKVNVEVYAYVKKNEKWMWKNIIPRLFRFLLQNIDGCEMAHNCPLKKGDIELILPLNLYKYSIFFGGSSIHHQIVRR